TIEYDDWENRIPRVEPNTHRILDRFSERGISATFFVLGWVAERFPQLVREIAARGHEVACHGYSHRLIYKQLLEVFRAETLRAKGLLEDHSQQPVVGYRAASYSITRRSLWALDILAEAGFTYDSSIFPVRHDRYGMPKAPTLPYSLLTAKGHRLVEFPLSTVSVLGYRLPMAGGGYFRLYPYGFTQWALRSINRQGQPFIFYLHPWEVDPAQPRIQAPRLSRFRHYNNLNRCEDRLERLLDVFSFTTAKAVLDDLGVWQQAPIPVTDHV
ncbi:MAG: DUF3473 domain-containing protein, partial [Gammaproteobacteria bacterium]|nr:DUF3473 domain-containing protein [Gammaproteobacteria bacterium]